jgi:CMP/dCMP kinase
MERVKRARKSDRGRGVLHSGATRGLVITVSGPHGSGKSTYAKVLAESLNLRYVSAGAIFRQLAKERGVNLKEFSAIAAHDPQIDTLIDERTRREADAGRVVVDAQLGAWIVKESADVKLLLFAPEEIRYKRIADRDGIPISLARDETIVREKIQKERYKKYYNIDVDDLSIYDIKVDTSLESVEATRAHVIQAVKRFLASKNPDVLER